MLFFLSSQSKPRLAPLQYQEDQYLSQERNIRKKSTKHKQKLYGYIGPQPRAYLHKVNQTYLFD